jgi:hypothetical protein
MSVVHPYVIRRRAEKERNEISVIHGEKTEMGFLLRVAISDFDNGVVQIHECSRRGVGKGDRM